MPRLKFEDNVRSKLHFEDKTRGSINSKDFSEQLGAQCVMSVSKDDNPLITFVLRQKILESV